MFFKNLYLVARCTREEKARKGHVQTCEGAKSKLEAGNVQENENAEKSDITGLKFLLKAIPKLSKRMAVNVQESLIKVK